MKVEDLAKEEGKDRSFAVLDSAPAYAAYTFCRIVTFLFFFFFFVLLVSISGSKDVEGRMHISVSCIKFIIGTIVSIEEALYPS